MNMNVALKYPMKFRIFSEFRNFFVVESKEVFYTALTEEEIEWLRNYQRERDIRERERDIRESREEGLAEGREEGITQAKLEDVECIVASGMADAEKACEVIGVNIEDYKEYKSSKERQ